MSRYHNPTGSDLRSACLDKTEDKTVRELLWRLNWPKKPRLLGTSTKVKKGEGKGYLTAVLYLLPSTLCQHFLGLKRTLCPYASEGCRAVCLGQSSGRLRFTSSRNAQAWKTAVYLLHPDLFYDTLKAELKKHYTKAHNMGLKPAVRLDGSSDTGLAIHFAPLFPQIQFYEYTKNPCKYSNWLNDHKAYRLYENLHFTFSASEKHTDAMIRTRLQDKGTVAIVCRDKPTAFYGYPVVDGDADDLRFLDPPGSLVVLSAKGTAKADRSGFVRDYSL